jgi:NADH dehydrogenase FAD-containing subunit
MRGGCRFSGAEILDTWMVGFVESAWRGSERWANKRSRRDGRWLEMTGQEHKRRLVLVGGGHVHLLALRHADRFVAEGVEVVLVGPDRFHYYSGMGPGMLSRIYKPEQARFDIQTMVESHGGVFVKGKVVSIDAASKELTLQGGEKIAYDLASFNIGSYVPMDRIPGAAETAIPVKPIENLELARDRILKTSQSDRSTVRILIIGAGPAGVELAGNMWRFARDEKKQAEITLASSRDRILPNLPPRMGALAGQSLTERGVRILSNFRVAAMEEGRVRSESGKDVPFDVAILTIGIMPQTIFADSGLETSEDGALMVNEKLQSPNSPDVFGGGDCIAIRGNRLDRVGVYAVREAPILFQNLLASLRGEPLRGFRPQKGYLLILNLGDGSGLLVWGSWIWKSRLAFALKNHLDTRFMTRFQISGERG